MGRIGPIILCAAVLAAGCMGADPLQSSQSQSATSEATGSLRGIVTLEGMSEHSGITVATTRGGYAATTAADGSFILPKIAAGSYDLRFEKSSYETTRLDGVSVNVGSEQALEKIALKPVGASPHGRIFPEDGVTTIYTQSIPLTVSASINAVDMKISESNVFADAAWQPILPEITYTFKWPGDHEIFYAFRDTQGLESMPASLRIKVLGGPGSWKALPATSDSPVARVHAAGFWTGKQMLVWGGFVQGATTNTGSLYDPATGKWTAMSIAKAPAAGVDTAAVWTGAKLIVWGGFQGENLLSPTQQTRNLRADGALYDPKANQWTPISNQGAPSQREAPKAVWTGQEMIVWGGVDDERILNNGALYNPSTDRWRPMTNVGAPSPRDYPVAVWIGNRFAVWGGLSPTGETFGDGFLYDPVQDLWTPMASKGAPSKREFATGLWTGQKLIVWGGVESNGRGLTTGALYDPQNDSWSTMTLTDAPSARNPGTAVWTGEQMLFWGGSGRANATLSDGAMYNPTTNVWSYISNLNIPIARTSQVNVWTGQSMIVWGGSVKAGKYDISGSEMLNDGGVFTPN